MFLRNLTLSCLLLCGLTSLCAETRHIHVIQMLDDNSQTYLIREGCRSIDYGVQRTVDRIQQSLGVTNVHYYRLSGLGFNRERLDYVLNYEMAYQERDIILFVYTGHGYRDAGSPGRLPKLYFNGYHNSLEGDELRMRLVEMNPSLLLNIVIACNAVQRDHRVAPGQPEDDGSDGNRLNGRTPDPQAYEVLFADQPGYTKVIDLVSADREYETFISRDGGIFFAEVAYAFEELLVDQRINSWEAFCSYVRDQTMLRTKERNLPQKPYCAYGVFLANAVPVVAERGEQLPCRQRLRELRRNQRGELKGLRRQHRMEMGASRGREARRLAGSRQQLEVKTMKHAHLQDYTRLAETCRSGSSNGARTLVRSKR